VSPCTHVPPIVIVATCLIPVAFPVQLIVVIMDSLEMVSFYSVVLAVQHSHNLD